MNTLTTTVTVTCYGITKEFETRQDAKNTLITLISNTEGLECERYKKALIQLECGIISCTDGEM